MHTLEQLETKQVGLRMPVYLLKEIDELLEDFEINRSTFINEAVKSMLKKQKEKRVHQRLDEAMSEVGQMLRGEIPKISARDTLLEMKNEA